MAGYVPTQPAFAPDGVETARPDILRQFELTERVAAYDPKADTDLIDAAYVMAMQAHGGQRRDNGDPYITHPVAVAGILAGYRLDTGSIVTALLHDVVEDTGVRLPEIARRFGPTVAGLVDGVTKLTKLELNSAASKQAENFRKLVLAMSEDIRVLLVKLADRLHNMRTLHFVTNADRRQRIARETMEIYAPLAERIGMDAMKIELQNLAFVQLDKEAYDSIQARLNFLRGQGADVIEEVRVELARICGEAGVEAVEVSGREKSPYSIWEKMQRRNVAFEQLSDIMAFRVVVPTRDACYMALGAVHAAYPVIAGRFKDYISTPKPNGYQSLHTGVTLREPRNQKIEVQIRTAEMQRVADNGVAAHWSYKQGEPSGPQDFPWVKDLLEILDNSVTGDDFLENTKLELYQDKVFCFTPKGQLIQLPRGATPVDFAYAVHSQVGDTCVGAKVNGRLLPLRYELQNGDQVEITTARGQHAVAVLGAVRCHRQGTRPHPPLRGPAAAPEPHRPGPCGPGQGLPAGWRGRVGEGSGSRPEGPQGGQPGRPVRHGRQWQYRAEGRGERLLPGAAGDRTDPADDPATALPRPQQAGQFRQHARDRVAARHGHHLRRLLPPHPG